jgi:DnaJ-class molecular chaperone
MKRKDQITHIIEELKLKDKFLHMHKMECCYDFDGHRSDLVCMEQTTPEYCYNCFGTGKYTMWYGETSWKYECGKCNGLGVIGGDKETRMLIFSKITADRDK